MYRTSSVLQFGCGYLAVTASHLYPNSRDFAGVHRSTPSGDILHRTEIANPGTLQYILVKGNALEGHGYSTLAKVGVGGSNPLARSILPDTKAAVSRGFSMCATRYYTDGQNGLASARSSG